MHMYDKSLRMHANYTRHMVPCKHKYPHELKYLLLLTNFNTSTGTYVPEFTVYKCCTYETTAWLLEIFFVWLKLHEIYNWQARTPNIHHSLFLLCHFVCSSSITRKLWGTCNTTTHQMTPLPPPRMRLFMLKAAKQTHIYITVSLCVQVGMTTNLGCLWLYYTPISLPTIELFSGIKCAMTYQLQSKSSTYFTTVSLEI